MAAYGKPLAGLCTATAIFVCGATGFPTPPDSLPPATGPLLLGDGSGPADVAPIEIGRTITLVADGFAGEAAVTVSLYSAPTILEQAIASESGVIDVAVTIPEDIPAGTHTLTALGNAPDGGVHSLQTEVDIIGAGASSGLDAGDLAVTGLNLGGMLAAGLIALVAGFALVRSTVFGRGFVPARH